MRSVGNYSSSISPKGIAAIVGVGPRLGRSIARKFAHEGYTVAILARDLEGLSRLAEEIAREEKGQVFAIRIDCSDSRSIQEAFEGVLSLGFVEVLVYNAYHQHQHHHSLNSPSPSPSPSVSISPYPSQPTSFNSIPVTSFEKSLAVSSVGAFHCAQQVLPRMVERGRGTILFTGCSASLTGIPGFSELCSAKFALRGLSQCLAREFQPHGVHVAHIILDGALATTRPIAATTNPASSSSSSSSSSGGSSSAASSTSCRHVNVNVNVVGNVDVEPVVDGGRLLLDPDVVAQTYWHLHLQDRSAWTQEIDLRPSPTSTNPTAAPSATARYFF